jgi:hypothetical protein
MTTLVLTQTTSLINWIFSLVKKVSKSVAFGVAMSRQCEANRIIANHLTHEYPNMDVYQIQSMLNERTLRDLRKEFGRV